MTAQQLAQQSVSRDINLIRHDLRTWAKDKSLPINLCCRNINGNLRILEGNPNDNPALAALRRNFVALKTAIASEQ